MGVIMSLFSSHQYHSRSRCEIVVTSLLRMMPSRGGIPYLQTCPPQGKDCQDLRCWRWRYPHRQGRRDEHLPVLALAVVLVYALALVLVHALALVLVHALALVLAVVCVFVLALALVLVLVVSVLALEVRVVGVTSEDNPQC